MKNKHYDSYFYELKIYPPHVCRYHKRLLGVFALLYYTMLYLADPFQVVGSLPGKLWFNVLLYVMVFVLSFGAVYRLLPALLQQWLPADRWSQWQQAMMLAVLVLLNALLLCALKYLWWGIGDLSPVEYLRTLERTLVVGVVPFMLYMTMLNLWKEQQIRKEEQAATPPAPALAPLLKKLRIAGDKLLYIESHANNKLIFYLDNNEIKQHMVRSSIRNLEEKYNGMVDFIRCSRSCTVNRAMVNVEQSYHLKDIVVLRYQNIQLVVRDTHRSVVRNYLKEQVRRLRD